MKGTHILGLITVSLWIFFLLVGLGLIDSVRSQHVPGYPSAGQIRYYIHFPAAVLALVIATWVLAAHWRPFRGPAVLLITLSLLALPGFLLFYTGGV
jgi:hypothetical protein